MNMIEVDPKLFIKCRLCLDETGQYQIVPNVQMQIKYCFDIDVESFDGLPQLICKKCESILSQYAGIKQIFQEKQKNLKTKINSKAKIDTLLQHQQLDTVSSSQENENKIKDDAALSCSKETTVPALSCSKETTVPALSCSKETTVPVKTPEDSFPTETRTSNLSLKRNKKTNLENKTQNTWESLYRKNFVCRYCSKYFKDKKGVIGHVKRQCKLCKKFSKINSDFCLVALNKIGSKPNLTGSIENVVCNENKIIQSKHANYYVIYSTVSNNQSDSSDSSLECFVTNTKKRKRQRLISRSSNETVLIDENEKRSDEEISAKVQDKFEKNKQQILSDIECVNIDDSDSNSAKSSAKTKDLESRQHNEEAKTLNDKMINNIIAMCSNKYMSRLNTSEGGNTNKSKEESSLKHKILSIGRKVVHCKGIVTTGLLRYMEHKNLEVVWIPKADTKATIKARSKEIGDSGKCWENLSTFETQVEDFANIFEKQADIEACIKEINKERQVAQQNLRRQENLHEERKENNKAEVKGLKYYGDSSNKDTVPDIRAGYVDVSISLQHVVSDTVERNVTDNNTFLRAVLDADRNWTKLLNANPVANPKQLPKKPVINEPASVTKIYPTEVNKGPDQIESCNTEKPNEMLHMPIITSTMSLAPSGYRDEQSNLYSNQKSNEMKSSNNAAQLTLPKIKLKPVSELMSNEALSQQQITSTFMPTTGWTMNNENQRQNVVLQRNDNNLLYIANPQFTNVIPVTQDVVYYSQTQNIQTIALNSNANQSGSITEPKNREYVILHTIELPNTRTESPFRYFQKLLEMHNLLLLDSIREISNSMKCLTKFKVVFEQESNSPVKLCLLLFCASNIFCIKAKDEHQKELDIAKFSANWQWEILKVFKGDDVVPKLLTSATRFGGPTYNYTNYFTILLRSIGFTKES